MANYEKIRANLVHSFLLQCRHSRTVLVAVKRNSTNSGSVFWRYSDMLKFDGSINEVADDCFLFSSCSISLTICPA